MSPETTDPTTLTGAYAINAVSPEERAAVEEHLATSQATRNEVTELQDTAVLLGLAAQPVTPSASLKERLMAQVAVTPQLAPLEASDTAVEPARHLSAVPLDAPASPDEVDVAAESPAPHTTLPTPAELKARSRWSRPIVAVASVAAAAAIIVGGGVTLSGVLAPTNEPDITAAQIAAIRAADDMEQKIVEDPAAGTSATVMWSGELEQAALIVSGMPQLGDKQDYELWFIGDDGARRAGEFDVNEDGSASRVLEGEMREGDVIGVTIEPEGGSDTPSGDPIMAVES